MTRYAGDDDCDDCKKDEKDGEKDEKGLLKELLDSRTIIISEEVSKELAKRVYQQLLILSRRSAEKEIYVYINSPGGDADSGFGIYDMLRFVECPIVTLVCGLCASAGVPIFLGADKGRNYSTPNSRFLLHQPSMGMSGDASDLEITAVEIDKTRERYNQIVAEATGQTLAKVTEDADRDFWLSPEEAKEYGLVASIISSAKKLK